MLAFDPTQRLSLAEIMHHPWVQGPLPTQEEVKAEFFQRMNIVMKKKEEERKKKIREKEIKKMMKEQGIKLNLYTEQKMHKSFDKEILAEVPLLKIACKLLEKFKDQKLEMTIEKFDLESIGLNYQYIKLNPDDMLEYLLLVLSREENVMNLQLDDESYSLSLCYAGDFGKLGLAIDFYENEGETVLNFRRNCGCAVNFNKGLSCFIEKFITPIFVKEEIKEEKKEE